MTEPSLLISTSKGNFRIVHHTIIRVLADGPYSYIYTEGKKYHCCMHLRAIKLQLKDSTYLYQVHRSHIINMNKTTGHFKKGKCCVFTMTDGAHIPVSRREKKGVMKMYKEKSIASGENNSSFNKPETTSSIPASVNTTFHTFHNECIHLTVNGKCPFVK